MRKRHYGGRQAFLMAVQLAYFHLRSDVTVHHINPRQCNVLFKNGRPHGGRDLTDLGTPDMHAIAMPDIH